MPPGFHAGSAFLIVAIEEAAQRAEHRALTHLSTTSRWSRSDDAIREARQWQGLQPDSSRSCERRKEQTFA